MKSGGQLKLCRKVSQKVQNLGLLEIFPRLDLFLKFWILVQPGKFRPRPAYLQLLSICLPDPAVYMLHVNTVQNKIAWKCSEKDGKRVIN